MPELVAAMSKNRVIGRDGGLPWHKLKTDMDHFKQITLGGAVIMGRTTYESLPEKVRPLPDRLNIVLTRGDAEFPGATVAHDLDEAFAIADAEERTAYVIGGGQIYEQALPMMDVLHLTVVDTEALGDTYFPELDMTMWKEVGAMRFDQDENNEYSGTFYTYERIQ